MKPPIKIWTPSKVQPIPTFRPLQGCILAARGLDLGSATAFLSDTPIIHDPMLLPDMDKGMALLAAAKDERQRIAVYMDSDADGLTAGALLVRALELAGFEVVPMIAERGNGFGPQSSVLHDLYKQGVGLVIAVDCGTGYPEQMSSRPSGLKAIVLDHHSADEDGHGGVILPRVDALINQTCTPTSYPCKEVSGAGMALKFVQAGQQKGILPKYGDEVMAKLEALATIGTVSDMMPLIDENHSLAKRGIVALAHDVLPGITAAREAFKWEKAILVPAVSKGKDVGFGLGAILNKAGKGKLAHAALHLLLTDNHHEAYLLAEELKASSHERHDADGEVLTFIKQQVDAMPDSWPAVVANVPEEISGQIGWVATRESYEQRRDAYIAKTRGDRIIGSARAFDEYPDPDVRRVLAASKEVDLITHYGGHKRSASFDMPAVNFPAFADFVRAETAKKFPDGIPPHVIKYDFVLYNYELTPEMWRVISPLAPFGKGNPEPILAAKDVKVLGIYYLDKEKPDPNRVKLMLKTGQDKIYAKVRNRPEIMDKLKSGSVIDLLFTVDKNSYSGNIELILVDWQPAPMRRQHGRFL